jgi:hypothetical protein
MCGSLSLSHTHTLSLARALSLCVSLSLFLSHSLSLSLSLSLSTYLSIYLSVRTSDGAVGAAVVFDQDDLEKVRWNSHIGGIAYHLVPRVERERECACE